MLPQLTVENRSQLFSFIRGYSDILVGMIRVTAQMYATCPEVRLLGDYLSFSNYFFVHKSFTKPTVKQQSLITKCNKGSESIVSDTKVLLDSIKAELHSTLRGVEATTELREVGSAKGGYALSRVCRQLSAAWNKETTGLNEEYFQAIIRKTSYYPWQQLNSPLSPILVCQTNSRPSNGSGQVVAVIMPFIL